MLECRHPGFLQRHNLTAGLTAELAAGHHANERGLITDWRRILLWRQMPPRPSSIT